MSDLASQLIECFDVLRSNDNDAIHEADQMINQLSLDDNIIPVLTELLQNENSYYRFHAATTLRLSLRGHDSESFSPGDLIDTLLQILSNEPDDTIRGYLIFVIGAQLINEETLPLAINFAQAALESSDQQQIHSAVLLLYNSMEKFKDVDDEFIQFVNQLTATAIEFEDIQLILDSLLFYFAFTTEYHDVPDEMASKFWDTAISLFPSQVDNPNSFFELSQIIGECIDNGPVFVDVEPLLPGCFQLLNIEELDYNIRNSLTYVIDAIVSIHTDFVIQSDMAIDIFQKYVQIAIDEYNPNEPMDLYDSSIMCNICQALSTNEEFLAMAWGVIQEFPQDDRGQYVSMIILAYLFNAEVDFFYSIFDDIAELICVSMQSESNSTSESGMLCLSEFIKVFTDVEDYLESFEQVLIELLQEKPSLLIVETLTKVIKKSENTDNIFEEAFPVLYQLIAQLSSETNTAILYALSALSLKSYSGVLSHYDTILGLMQELLENESEEAEKLRGDVVECLINLMRASPESFQPYLETFIPSVLSFLSIEDSNLICAALNCIGTIVDLFPEEIAPTVPDILNVAEQLALDDHSEYFKQIKNLIREGFTDDEIDEMVDMPVIDQDSFDIAGGAFLVFSSILSKFPELIQENFERTVNIIKILSKSYIENSTRSVCVGVEYIMESISEANIEDPSLIEEIFINLKIIIERATAPEIVGSAICSIAAIIDATGFEFLGPHMTALPDDIISILELNLNCFYEDQQELPECLFSPLLIFFGAIFKVLSEEDCQEFMKDIIPEIFELSSKSNSEKAFSLDVLVNYAQCGYSPAPDFLPKILELAIECINNNYSSGFVALENLSNFAPELLKENAESLLKIYAAKLTDDNKAQLNYQQVMDDCVSSLGAFAINVLGDDFPLQELGQIALARMPPKKNPQAYIGCYNFLLWMIPRGFAYLKADIIAAFARLFALPPLAFKSLGLPQEFLDLLKETFIKILQKTPEGDEICSEAVGNNPIQLQLIQNAIES